jgi:hypothetical protein
MRPRILAHTMLALLSASVIACRDDAPTERPQVTDAAPNEVVARLVFSNLEPRPGDEFVVLVQVASGADVRSVGSFTGALTYDSTAARFIAEHPLTDDATRVMNPLPGETRVAGISLRGFRNGRLVALRFEARTSGATTDMHMEFDQLHAVDREDLRRVTTRSDRKVDRTLEP